MVLTLSVVLALKKLMKKHTSQLVQERRHAWSWQDELLG